MQQLQGSYLIIETRRSVEPRDPERQSLEQDMEKSEAAGCIAVEEDGDDEVNISFPHCTVAINANRLFSVPGPLKRMFWI